jgi:hypothetical protein
MKKTVLTISLLFCSLSFLAQNNYLDFDGVNDFVSVPNSGSLISGATTISMSCKVYPKNANTGWPDFDGFIGYRNDSNCDFYITQVSSTGVEARYRNSSGTVFNLTYNGMVLNQWNHFFLVYNGSTFKLYSGATEVATTSASGSMPASVTNLFQIGVSNYYSTAFYFKGYIDEVSLWNKALTATEISTINTNSGEIANPTSETQLKVYYKFNQGIAYGTNTGLTTLIDEKATQNGTLNNFNLSGTSSNWGSETLNTKQFNTSAFKVYPNPTTDLITVSGLEPIENLKIVDFMGRTVMENNDSSNNFSVANLNSGVYFLIINQDQTVKFIKK